MALNLTYKKTLGRSFRAAPNALELVVSHDWTAMKEPDRLAFQGLESSEPRMLQHGFETYLIDGNNLEVHLPEGTVHQFELKLVNTYYSEPEDLDNDLEEEIIHDPYSRDGREG